MHRSVVQLARDCGGIPAVVSPERVLSWRELGVELDRLAEQLRALGISRVVAVLEQDASGIALMGACDAAGVTAAYSSALFGLDHARDAMIGADADAVIAIRDARVSVIARRSRGPEPSGSAEIVLLSSGTTGRPKYVRHTWAGLAAAAKPGARAERWLLAYPLSQFAALQVIAQCVATGAALVIPRDFSPAAAMHALVEHGVTSMSCTPTYLRRLLLSTPADAWSAASHVRQLTLGGEIVPQALLDAVHRVLPDARVVHIYASTELGALITVRDGREGFDAALIDGRTLRIEGGELWARRTERAMLGYLGHGEPPEWIATGDLVEQVADRVHFRGRATEIINVGGSKVYPAEVEAVVRDVPGVIDVRVVGHASSITGQVVKAIVHVDAGADRDALQRAITAACSGRLRRHMVPRLYELTEQLEVSLVQKLARRPSE